MDFSHSQRPTPNFTGLTIVVLLHVFVAVMVIYFGGSQIKKMIVKDNVAVVEIPPPPPPPPPPDKALPPPPPLAPPPPIYIPPPEILISSPVIPPFQAPSTTIVNPDAPKYDPHPAPTGPTTGVGSYEASSSCGKPDYPASSERNEEEGTSTVAFLVGADGNVKKSRVEKSSGHSALDKAALAAFSACKFKPAMAGGVPVEGWKPISYVWKLN